MRVLLGLGTNLGDRKRMLDDALEALDRVPGTHVERCSSVYETVPVGVPDEQPCYLNMVAEVLTDLSPKALLGVCLGIEAMAGRERPFAKAARVLDIDVLLCEGFMSCDPELTVPHPRMGERAFVLVPMSELYPDFVAFDYSFASIIKETGDQVVKKFK